MHLADYRVARHIAQLGRNLAGRKSAFPKFFELFDAIVGPGQYRHRTLSLATRRPNVGDAAIKAQKNPSRQNPLARAGRKKSAPNVYAEQLRLTGSNTTARDVVPDNLKATIWRDSGARVRRHASTCSVTMAAQCALSATPAAEH